MMNRLFNIKYSSITLYLNPKGWRNSSAVEHLLSMNKALDSVVSTMKKKRVLEVV